MITREDLIEAGRDTMGRSSSWRWWAPRHLTMLLDVWEPMIRTDEREQDWRRHWRYGAAEAEIRKQVADEIRAERDQFIRVTRAAADDLPVLAYTDAARVAEEGRNDEA